MPYTDKVSDVAQAIVDLLKDNWDDLGLNDPEDVFYGNEARIGRFPAIAVDPSPGLNAELTGTMMQATNTFEITILVYEGALKNQEVKRKDCDQRAEAIRAKLLSNKQLGGLVAHGHVLTIEPGFSNLQAQLVVASRMGWQGISKTQLV